MRRIARAIAAAGIIAGSLAGAQTANAAAVDVTVPPPAPTSDGAPIISALDCIGGTGIYGCGPGWVWRDGWRGWACYVC